MNNDAVERPVVPGETGASSETAQAGRGADALFLRLHAEEIAVSKRLVAGQRIRVTTKTNTRDVVVEEALNNESVVIERVPVGRYVDAVPDIRQDGDLTVMPVVDEEVVVTRRLFLREEVHVRRTRTTTMHTETVTLRAQQVVVSREATQPSEASQLSTAGAASAPSSSQRSTPMEAETIVAVYDTAAHAELAANDLREAGVPDTAITLHRTTPNTAGEPVRETGFWSSLFGGDAASDSSVYERSVASGSTVLTVKASDSHVARAMEILESHHPIDIDERATGYGLGSTDAGMTATSASMTTGAMAHTAPGSYAGAVQTGTAGLADEAGTLQLAEESLAVGKRLVNLGGTRIRRYVVETPVEESVSLHSEKVTLERHPVTDGRPVTDASFGEKTIEMTETAEEAVVSKTARVVEEVGLRKEASDRVETIHDTLRKEEVEVEQIPGTTTTTTGTYATPKV